MSSTSQRKHQFERWVEQYAGSVFHTLRAMGLEAEQAREASQETFVQAWRSMGRFEGRSKEKTWLLGIASNVGLKLLRKEKRTSHLHQAAARLAASGSTASGESAAPEQLLAQKQRHQQLHRLIGQLGAKKKQVFVLFYLEDLTVPEIAEALSMPAGSVRSTLQRAKEEVSGAWLSFKRDDAMYTHSEAKR